MPRIILIGYLSGAVAVPLFHEGTAFLLFHGFGWIQWLFGVPDEFRPLSAGFNLRLSPPLGLPELVNLVFWGGIWGVVLASVVRLVRPPMLLSGFLFGAVLCTGFGFAPFYGERALPIWGGVYFANWARAALINGAWGWGAAALMRGANLNERFRR